MDAFIVHENTCLDVEKTIAKPPLSHKKTPQAPSPPHLMTAINCFLLSVSIISAELNSTYLKCLPHTKKSYVPYCYLPQLGNSKTVSCLFIVGKGSTKSHYFSLNEHINTEWDRVENESLSVVNTFPLNPSVTLRAVTKHFCLRNSMRRLVRE